jgi:hypothetical protein
MKTLGTLLALAALALLFVVASGILQRIETFGMSPGTLDQLQSTHVPSQRELRQQSIELTGSL